MEDLKYTTTDLYLSAFLKTSGHRLSVVKAKNKFVFSFEETPELIELVNNYLMDSAICNPLAYANSIKNIKNLLHNL
jgi:hypothetical protein